jgi:predicted RNase H-like HicB family nuclease
MARFAILAQFGTLRLGPEPIRELREWLCGRILSLPAACPASCTFRPNSISLVSTCRWPCGCIPPPMTPNASHGLPSRSTNVPVFRVVGDSCCFGFVSPCPGFAVERRSYSAARCAPCPSLRDSLAPGCPSCRLKIAGDRRARYTDPMKLRLVVEHDPETERWAAFFPELPGCASAGDSEEEAVSNAKEALELWFEPSSASIPAGAKVLEVALQ